jgi:hypothetical protein
MAQRIGGSTSSIEYSPDKLRRDGWSGDGAQGR